MHWRSHIWLAAAIILAVGARTGAASQGDSPAAPTAVQVRASDGTTAWYEPAADGSGVYVYSAARNPRASDWPFLSLFYSQGRSTRAIALFLFGLLGQAMFMGRFALQWIVSERRGRSVVPLGFWWLSLAGASILLAYFIVQGEPIGILGQILGWPIYLRNVYMVLRDRNAGRVDPIDPAAHPVPDPNAEA
ncbi:MAG: lipid-A-disaccharide synthase N-terminal domain-containing protein [Phycisphaerales bacterium]|nr:lipid-A-disaccharide synthase N-terminal domain-containing protein [Phycisphaerales bacterium]